MKAIIGFLFILVVSVFVSGQKDDTGDELFRVDGNPKKGFNYAYYLYVPNALAESDPAAARPLIVIPNNTGKIDDDIAFHDDDVKRKVSQIGPYMMSSGIAAPLLMPVFPRPASEHHIYTHSLDRDTLTDDKRKYHRLDLQLIAMIKDARIKLNLNRVRTEDRVLMQGYSASGMFVNRFVFMHPEIVKAAIVGAPGGWAIAPVSLFKGKTLTYPAGIADLKSISGKPFKLKLVRSVPLMMVLGAEDTNDAVPMGDAYDQRETDLVISLFGRTPIERWAHTVELYRQAKLNAEFKLYPGTGHQMSGKMREDMISFFLKYL